MKLELYYFDECPYCQKVLKQLSTMNLQVTMKNIRKTPTFREELLQIGGKGQVPCLIIDGKPMYESDDIVHWLKTHT